MELVGDVVGERILDIGCGFGALAIALAKRKAQVTAFDPSAQMIARACRGAEENHQQVDFIQATMAGFQEKCTSLFDEKMGQEKMSRSIIVPLRILFPADFQKIDRNDFPRTPAEGRTAL